MLRHAYDPIKRKEYYERTKELKGRSGGSADNLNGSFKRTYPTPSGPAKGPTPKPAFKRVAAPKKSTTQTLTDLNARLKQLRELLKTLVAQAKERSGVESGPKSKSDSKKAGSDKPSKTTASEKKAAAEASKKYREKNKTPDQKIADIRKQIAEVQKKIAEARAKLAEAGNASTKKSSAGANSFKRMK